jgi:hypothetical protein
MGWFYERVLLVTLETVRKKKIYTPLGEISVT